jgi:hypothetical protein
VLRDKRRGFVGHHGDPLLVLLVLLVLSYVKPHGASSSISTFEILFENFARQADGVDALSARKRESSTKTEQGETHGPPRR